VRGRKVPWKKEDVHWLWLLDSRDLFVWWRPKVEDDSDVAMVVRGFTSKRLKWIGSGYVMVCA